jgi:DNA-binding GntR family transcriptional regulator
MAKSPNENYTVKQTGGVRVYGILREEILQMHLAPGSRLDEAGLSERFGLSRSPIREALVRLSDDGLVQILPNRSPVVTPMDFRRIPEFFDALGLLQRVTTRLAALHRTAAELAMIRKAQKAYEKAIAASIKSHDSLGMVDRNYEFHMAIAKASRNDYFAGLYRRLLDEGRRMLHLHFQYEALGTDLSLEEMARDHADMVDAIETGDADRAEEYAYVHAMQFRRHFMQCIDRNLAADAVENSACRGGPGFALN